MAFFPKTDIYALTDSTQSLGRSTLDVVRAMLAGGVKVIQYREKRKSSGEMLAECRIIRSLTRAAHCCFIVNDHLDIAILSEADGAHIGQEDISLSEARRLLGPKRIIGVSVSNQAEAEKAVAGGADYLGMGAIFPTETKKDVRHAGLNGLDDVLALRPPVPVAVIGGINERTLPEVVRHGAECFAVVSAITLAPDIPAKVADLRAIIRAARRPSAGAFAGAAASHAHV